LLSPAQAISEAVSELQYRNRFSTSLYEYSGFEPDKKTPAYFKNSFVKGRDFSHAVPARSIESFAFADFNFRCRSNHEGKPRKSLHWDEKLEYHTNVTHERNAVNMHIPRSCKGYRYKSAHPFFAHHLSSIERRLPFALMLAGQQ
jgi:hypothetical protein